MNYLLSALKNSNTSLHRERKPPPTPKFQPKVIQDWNPDFQINPDPDALPCQHQSSFRKV